MTEMVRVHRSEPAATRLRANQIWCAIVALACELTAWMQTLALADTTRPAGNPNGCDYGCSRSLDASPTPAATSYYTYPRTHATSARIFPRERSTHFSSFGKNSSISIGCRCAPTCVNRPSSRACTQCATVC
jgi:hypothetical protein